MKVVGKTVIAPLRVETPQQLPIGSDTQTLPPIQKAERSALIAGTGPAQQKSVGPLGRPKAPWSAASVDIANQALAAAKGKRGDDAVRAVVEHLLARPELRGANLSCVVTHASGAPIIDAGGDKAVNPCSNAKLVTAAFALSTLKPTYRFPTRVYLAGDGALYVKGSFDPTLDRAAFMEIAQAVKGAKVSRIVVDNSALTGTNTPRGFVKYGEQDWEYLARPEPLSVDRNLVEVVVTPGEKPGDVARIAANTTAFAIDLDVQTLAPGTEFKVGCDEQDAGGVLQRDANGKALLTVWGTIAGDYHKGKKLKMKSPAPEEQALAELQNAFAAVGMKVDDVAVGETPRDAPLVFTHNSAPLSEILQSSLANSNAFDHEMLALAATYANAVGPVSLDDAAQALTRFVHDELGGAGALVNGSGIGNESTLSAKTVAEIFRRAHTTPKLAPLLESLSVPGVVGTLKTRLLDTDAEKSFRGKTGTGDRAVALSGVTGDLVMSLLVEKMRHKREDTRAVLDAMAIALSSVAL